MTDTNDIDTEGKCVLCGNPAHWSAKLPVVLPPLTGTGEQIGAIKFPKMWLCREVHMRQWTLNREIVGWCDECFAWGPSLTASQCGVLCMP